MIHLLNYTICTVYTCEATLVIFYETRGFPNAFSIGLNPSSLSNKKTEILVAATCNSKQSGAWELV